MVKLIELSVMEYEVFRKNSILDYAADCVKAGRIEEKGAREWSENMHHTLLPNGIHTPDHYLFKIVDSVNNESVGNLWINTKLAPTKSAFIYDIVIHPSYRGKRYGHSAMLELEKWVQKLGFDKISLNVFGWNEAAINLYNKTGYAVQSQIMTKKI